MAPFLSRAMVRWMRRVMIHRQELAVDAEDAKNVPQLLDVVCRH